MPGQATTQDAGVFITSHTAGTPAQAVFSGFAVSSEGLGADGWGAPTVRP
ncbi:MAG TPA: hypothetical protein VGD29_28255 [Actinoplanes sp.]